jgi:hypothetical protein
LSIPWISTLASKIASSASGTSFTDYTREGSNRAANFCAKGGHSGNNLYRGDPTLATKVALGNAYRRVGHGCGDTPVGCSSAVSQVVAKVALDRNAVAVHAVDGTLVKNSRFFEWSFGHSNKLIERHYRPR